jgi:hypothetical protein
MSDFNWETRPILAENKHYVFQQTSCLDFLKSHLLKNVITNFQDSKYNLKTVIKFLFILKDYFVL